MPVGASSFVFGFDVGLWLGHFAGLAIYEVDLNTKATATKHVQCNTFTW
jgi:hypothetical protein